MSRKFGKAAHRQNGSGNGVVGGADVPPTIPIVPKDASPTLVPPPESDSIKITDVEAESFRKLDNALGKLKITLADVAMREEELMAQEAQLRKQREAVVNEIKILQDQMLKTARALAMAHGVDLDSSEKWNLDTTEMVFHRVG